MVTEYIFFVVGIFLLVKSADWIVDGASSLSRKLGVSSLIIGLTIVAFGTSLPELIVNLFAVSNGNGEIAFGNIVGSNIANVLLVLGLTAMVGKVKITNNTVWKEIPFALLAAFVFFVLSGKILFGGENLFTMGDGLVLLSLFSIFLYYAFQRMKASRKNIPFPEDSKETNTSIIFSLIFGLVGIYFGGKFVVDGAVFIAGQLGLSEFLISATIIAIGTSLPELVVCVIAALRRNVDLAVGNIIGSNIFNILWVFGVIPFFGVLRIPEFVLFDIGVMFCATLLLFVFMFLGKHELNKKDGFVFVLFYVLYIWFIIVRG